MFTLTFDLYRRPSSDEACSVLLPVLVTVVLRRGKKLAVRVAQCVAALVPVRNVNAIIAELC